MNLLNSKESIQRNQNSNSGAVKMAAIEISEGCGPNYAYCLYSKFFVHKISPFLILLFFSLFRSAYAPSTFLHVGLH